MGTLIGIVSGMAVVGIVVVLIRHFSRKKVTTPASSTTVITGSAGGGGGGVTVPTVYNAYTIKKAFLSNSNYVPYATLEEALDKNLENSGFTNQDGTVYASSMENDKVAFNDAIGNTLFPSGNYFYEPTFEMLYIDVNGVMTFSSIVNKTGLNSQNINDLYQ